MKYAIFFCPNPETVAGLSEAERADVMTRYVAYGREAMGSARVLAGEKLRPVDTATTVRVRRGERVLTDGPFAETAEHLAGFMLVECESLDEAIALAAKHPDAELGACEVRPVEEWQAPG